MITKDFRGRAVASQIRNEWPGQRCALAAGRRVGCPSRPRFM